MPRYSGNLLRMNAPRDPQQAPGEPDAAHDAPSGPEGVPDYRAQEISTPPDLGAEYAGLTLEDGVPRAVTAGQPGIGWNPADAAMVPPGSGQTPAGWAPRWTHGDPHNAAVDTSHATAARGQLPGGAVGHGVNSAHSVGDDTLPYRHANPVGVAGTRFLERLAEFPRALWGEPTGPGADKFIAGTNGYGASNPEGDNFAEGRGGGRVFYGFETDYFVHTPMYQDKPAQTYERRTAPVTARDPLVGGAYANTPQMGQLAANPWLSELGESVTPEGYGVAVDGVM